MRFARCIQGRGWMPRAMACGRDDTREHGEEGKYIYAHNCVWRAKLGKGYLHAVLQARLAWGWMSTCRKGTPGIPFPFTVRWYFSQVPLLKFLNTPSLMLQDAWELKNGTKEEELSAELFLISYFLLLRKPLTRSVIFNLCAVGVWGRLLVGQLD